MLQFLVLVSNMTAPVLIWPVAYIALRYPRGCLLLARIHGHVCAFYNELFSKSLQLPTPIHGDACCFHSNELACFQESMETCLPSRFLEKAYMSLSNYKFWRINRIGLNSFTICKFTFRPPTPK
jgi:hypothetical protein